MDSSSDKDDGLTRVGFLFISFKIFVLNGEHVQVFARFSFLDDLISVSYRIRYHVLEPINIVFHFPVRERNTQGNIDGLSGLKMVINHEVDLVSVLNNRTITMRYEFLRVCHFPSSPTLKTGLPQFCS